MKLVNDRPYSKYFCIQYTSYGYLYEHEKMWTTDTTIRKKLLMVNLLNYKVSYRGDETGELGIEVAEKDDLFVNGAIINNKTLAMAEEVKKVEIGPICIKGFSFPKEQEEFIKMQYKDGIEVVYFENLEGSLLVAKLDLD